MLFTQLVRYLLFIGILLLVTTNVSSRSLKSVGNAKHFFTETSELADSHLWSCLKSFYSPCMLRCSR